MSKTALDEYLDLVNHESHSMFSYLDNLTEGYKAGKKIPEVREIIEKTEREFKKRAEFLTNAEIKALSAKLTREAELKIRKIANEKPEKEKKETEEGSHLVKKPTPFDATINTDEKFKKEENVNKTTAIASTSPEKKVENSPLTTQATPLKKAPQSINKLPTQPSGKGIARGGDVKGRGSKPVRPILGTNPSKPSVASSLLTSKGKAIPVGNMPPGKSAQSTPKTPMGKPPEKKPVSLPKTKIIIPPLKIPDKSDKTKATPFGPLKPFVVPPGYGGGDEIVTDYEIPEIDRGPAVTGNPNKDQEPYIPYAPPFSPRRETADDDDNSDQDDTPDEGGGRSGRKQRKKKKRKMLPKNPLGGGSGKAASAALKLVARGTLMLLRMGPVGWGILIFIIIVLVILALFIMDDAKEQYDKNKSTETTLTIEKQKISPPTLEAKRGEIITFTITVRDTQPASEVTVIDYLPLGVSLVEKDIVSSWTKRTFDAGKRTITWKASENAPTSLNPPNFTITVKYKVIANQINLVTWAEANAIGAGGAGGPVDINAKDFESLVKGQGRNTQILGDENSFVNTLMKNGSKHFTGKEAQLRALYKAAIAKRVNPLIMAVIWGVEAGFRVNGTEFGCKPFHSGFAAQVECSAKTLNKHMTDFEQANKIPFPHPVAPQCTFTDAFVYAYERYTPVCAISDSNGNARTNFVKYFKELYGTGTPAQ